jgi:hypothetical protein
MNHFVKPLEIECGSSGLFVKGQGDGRDKDELTKFLELKLENEIVNGE